MAKDKEPPKHRAEPKNPPKWTRPNPGAGKHGVPDKGAMKKPERNQPRNPPKHKK